jgi:serine/threonine protein kinase
MHVPHTATSEPSADAVQMRRVRLRVIAGETAHSTAQRVTIILSRQQPVYRVGSSPECELQLDHPAIRARHCALEMLEDRIWIRHTAEPDARTLVNGVSLEGSRRLADGDEIRLGDHLLIAGLDEEHASPHTPVSARNDAGSPAPRAPQVRTLPMDRDGESGASASRPGPGGSRTGVGVQHDELTRRLYVELLQATSDLHVQLGVTSARLYELVSLWIAAARDARMVTSADLRRVVTLQAQRLTRVVAASAPAADVDLTALPPEVLDDGHAPVYQRLAAFESLVMRSEPEASGQPSRHDEQPGTPDPAPEPAHDQAAPTYEVPPHAMPPVPLSTVDHSGGNDDTSHFPGGSQTSMTLPSKPDGSPPVPHDDEPEVPDLPDLTPVTWLRRGGSGTQVMVAFSHLRNCEVAVKLLRSVLPTERAQLQIEYEAVSRLRHECIVRVLNFEQLDAQAGCYYVMDYIKGSDGDGLLGRLRDHRVIGFGQRLTGEQLLEVLHLDAHSMPRDFPCLNDPRLAYYALVAWWMCGLCDGLAEAHAKGIYHGDIKPANMLLSRATGRLMLTDFGLATIADNAKSLRQQGGTPRYLSPERVADWAIQRNEGSVTPAADVWSFGATMYEFLTLTPAYKGSDIASVLRGITTVEPTDACKLNVALPEELGRICHKALQRNPRERYDRIKDMANDLQRWLDDASSAGSSDRRWWKRGKRSRG